MKLTEIFLADLEREVPATRRVLERVPEGRFDWKPHEKSMPMGYLSILVATMPSWIDTMVNQNELDFAPNGGSGYKAPELRTAGEYVKALEDSVAKARMALKGTTDKHLLTTWSLLAGGHVVSELPRHVNIRDGVLSHWA
ncbi:MAG: damage-inducible protein DinB, partial [Thermoanaerobaculia bacterium]